LGSEMKVIAGVHGRVGSVSATALSHAARGSKGALAASYAPGELSSDMDRFLVTSVVLA